MNLHNPGIPKLRHQSAYSSTAKLRIWMLGIWGFRGTGFHSAREVLCAAASRLFLDHFCKHLSSLLGRSELCHEVRNPGPQKPQIIRNENHHLSEKKPSAHSFLPAILGPEMVAPTLEAPDIFRFFLLENSHAHKIPHFWGAVGFFGRGGGCAKFIFMGAGIFLNLALFDLCVRVAGRDPSPGGRIRILFVLWSAGAWGFEKGVYQGKKNT